MVDASSPKTEIVRGCDALVAATSVLGAHGEFNFGVAILAAGLSTRMGQPKLLLPWGDTSVLGHLLKVWQSLNAGQLAVVCAARATGIHGELDRLGFAASSRILNPSPETGMFGSIQCAARWAGWQRSLSHVALVLGDQPHLQRRTLGLLLEFSAAHPTKVCQPLRNGHRRHPVVLPRRSFADLSETSASNLREFLQSTPQRLAGMEVDDPGLDLDLNSPADYERAKSVAT